MPGPLGKAAPVPQISSAGAAAPYCRGAGRQAEHRRGSNLEVSGLFGVHWSSASELQRDREALPWVSEL